MNKSNAKLMAKVAGLFAEVSAQLFGEGTRVEFTLNPHSRSNYHLCVGPISEYDEFYDFGGEDWILDREGGARTYHDFLKEAGNDLD